MSMEEIIQFHSLARGPQMEQTEGFQPCWRFALFECFNSSYKFSIYGDILGILHNEEMKIPNFFHTFPDRCQEISQLSQMRWKFSHHLQLNKNRKHKFTRSRSTPKHKILLKTTCNIIIWWSGLIHIHNVSHVPKHCTHIIMFFQFVNNQSA